MGPKGKLRRLENAMRGQLESFELEDGSRHYFDRTSGERFLHSMACLRAQGRGETTYPEPPDTLRAILRAKDRRAAFEQVYHRGALDIFPYDTEALVDRGELVPHELGEPIEDLSEP